MEEISVTMDGSIQWNFNNCTWLYASKEQNTSARRQMCCAAEEQRFSAMCVCVCKSLLLTYSELFALKALLHLESMQLCRRCSLWCVLFYLLPILGAYSEMQQGHYWCALDAGKLLRLFLSICAKRAFIRKIAAIKVAFYKS
jgi:hypothetical protein